MLLTKILFLVLIVVCIFFYILYTGNFALVLLVIMIALPIIMFVTTYISKKKTTVEFAMKDKVVSKNQSFPIQLVINNRSFFPIGKAEAHIEYYNVFNNQITSFELYLPIQARNSQRVTFQISSKFCGIVNIKAEKITVYDPLRIFKFNIADNTGIDIAVLPEAQEIGGTVNYTDRINDESDKFSEYFPGDDPSEVFDLREYAPGDKLNHIHWKLSSKKDEFIVKEYSMPTDVPCVVFLNLKCYEDSDYTLPVFDTLVETLLSVSQFLVENERPHKIVFYNAQKKQFEDIEIDSTETLSEAIRMLILSINDNLYCEPPDAYFSEKPISSLSSFTFITSPPDNEVFNYIDEETDADLKNAIVIVKNPEESAKIQADYSSLRIIPVTIGRISASIKDIEI